MKKDRFFIFSILIGLGFILMTFFEKELINSLWVLFYWIYVIAVIILIFCVVKSIIRKRFRLTLILLLFVFSALIYNATQWEAFKSEAVLRAYSTGTLSGDVLILRKDNTYDVQSISFIGYNDEWSGKYDYDGEKIILLSRNDLEHYTPDTFKIIHSVLVDYGDYIRNLDSLILIDYDITYNNLHNPNRLERFYWFTEYDVEYNYEYLVKGDLFEADDLTNQEIIDVLNQRKTKCSLRFIEISSDTINIRIVNDEVLSEQMGTSGALCYIGETIFTLTEKDNINYVNLVFNEGSHAVPGIYSREDFKELLKRDL